MSTSHGVHYSEPSKYKLNCVDPVEGFRKLSEEVPMLVVGNEKPFVVHEANDAFVSKFGFDKNLVCGRSIGFLQGPKTNTSALMGSLGTQAKGCGASTDCAAVTSAAKPVVLYSKSGEENTLNVRSVPMKTVDGTSLRLVSFDFSRTVALNVAQEESVFAKVILEASSRQAVVFANSIFLEIYGLKENQVLATKSIMPLHGPNTPIHCFARTRR